MAKVNANIPSTSQSFYSAAQRQSLITSLAQIQARYRAPIELAAGLCNVPAELIAGFIFIESNGEEQAKNASAYGLMQVTPATCDTVIIKENLEKRLSADEQIELRKILGSRLDTLLAKKFLVPDVYTKGSDLYNPAFNILVGTMYLGRLIDEFTSLGLVRLDKVVVKYNRGYFAKVPSGSTTDKLLNNIQGVTRDYILKLVGTNGVMDVLTEND